MIRSVDFFASDLDARGGPVAEGNVGGGTGMNCHGFRGVTGTASRRLSETDGGFTVGVLVQCNYGTRTQLRIAGIPVGREVTGVDPCVVQLIDPPVRAFDGKALPPCTSTAPAPNQPAEEPEQGSIIIVVATDAPFSPDQLKRVVRRVALGMGRMGSNNGNGSGDIFIAFSTANRGADWGNSGRSALPAPTIQRLGSGLLDPIFTATVEATEEAILNALMAAETMNGADYRRAWAIPHAQVKAILARYKSTQPALTIGSVRAGLS